MARGEPTSARALAREACRLLRLGGSSADAVEDRLRKKFARKRISGSANSDFRPKTPRAVGQKIDHDTPEQELVTMYHSLRRNDLEVPPMAGEPPACATVRVIHRPSEKDDGPEQVVSLRIAVGRDAMIEHRVSLAVAKGLLAELTDAVSSYEGEQA